MSRVTFNDVEPELVGSAERQGVEASAKTDEEVRGMGRMSVSLRWSQRATHRYPR